MASELDQPAKSEISPNDVRATLNKIVSSDAFGKAERPARFLRHLVESALRGDVNCLKESLLGVDVFDRPSDWDPREVPIVRQEAARLRRRLAKYYEIDGTAGSIRIELPVGTYVPVFRRELALGSPTIEGHGTDPGPAQRRSLWPYAVAAVLAVVCITGIWAAARRFLHRDSGHDASMSIAVLPFTNLSGDPADQYFVDGLTDEVTDSLVRLKTLRVNARSSSAVFKNQPRDLKDIARQLRVSHLLEANVERSGDNVNLIATLIRTSDGTKIWTNTYRRSVADVTAIQTDLTEGVRASLGIAAPADQKQHIPPNQAHEYYLKARFEGDQISMDANSRSQEYYRRALQLDPDYALAWDGLSGAIWNRANADGEPFQPAEIRKSEEALEKAVQLDPDLGGAHVGLAMFAMRYDFDWSRAERELHTALALRPDVGAELNYANLCLILGRRQEADEHFQRSRDMDSLSSQAVLNDVQFLTVEGRFEEARDETRKIAARSPTNQRLQMRLDFWEAWFGDAAAKARLRGWTQRFPHAREFLAAAEAHNGNREEALRLLAPLEREYLAKHIAVYGLASIRAELNDEASAVKLLDQAIDAREDWTAYIHVDVAFARMQNTPAFHRLKKRMDLDW